MKASEITYPWYPDTGLHRENALEGRLREGNSHDLVVDQFPPHSSGVPLIYPATFPRYYYVKRE